MSSTAPTRQKIVKERDLLRFTTAGSVDDGKSTLIGRMLFDSKQIFQDQMDQLESASKLRGWSEAALPARPCVHRGRALRRAGATGTHD